MGDSNVTDWIGALATAFTALVAVAAAIFAYVQVREARRVREQTAALEVERSQPYVEVFVEQDRANPAIFDLVVKNFGATAARHLRLSLDPWPQRSQSGNAALERVGVPVLPSLGPGQEWRTWWDAGTMRIHSDLPKRHDGSVTYTGVDGATRRTPVSLDLAIFEPQVYSTKKTLNHVVGQLEKIVKALSKR